MFVALLQLPGVKTKPFSDEYDLKEELGIGTYSICKKCVHKVNGQEFAVKVRHAFSMSDIGKVMIIERIEMITKQMCTI